MFKICSKYAHILKTLKNGEAVCHLTQYEILQIDSEK